MFIYLKVSLIHRYGTELLDYHRGDWSAYCNCMADLGETCTHTAILLYLEASAISTQCKCEWLIPSFHKSTQYLPLKISILLLQKENLTMP